MAQTMTSVTIRKEIRGFLWMFSIVTLGLSCARLHYTLYNPPTDPLNSSKSYHDPIVVELIVTSALTYAWTTRLRRYYDAEKYDLPILFALWLVGAVFATVFLPVLSVDASQALTS
ncbi:uncharacterized protein PHACADRAFT_214982 [Phanerochaete carnosa HHB-10118-sp]|uniref:Uncharacterized protein n=1 Tax=Phanerochaete carnosa (strain HHB-10118-sp) TaxID=650164 RepID=K5VAB8_PHACS|nr:uncharacterized protein PHACADRAFT_214982 [Phanerochaete carnosa HHB-10118-sp]EKM48033.1 hypothetical protein PHACADRAFT_214982 [Phanerochaete carnosa HHB-10118-sp]